MRYIAYGSNMNLEQMKYRCPNSRRLGTGYIPGWKLAFSLHATIVPGKPTDKVPVVLWDIVKSDWGRLDAYEGYPRYYRKEKLLTVYNGKQEECVVYIMNKDKKPASPPTRSYLETIIEGCKENGIDASYIIQTLRSSFGEGVMEEYAQ